MSSLSSTWCDKAREIVGERILFDLEALERYSRDEFPMDIYQAMPEAVVKPRDEREIIALVRLCRQEHVPLTVRGGGTGLSAGCVPSPGGIVLSLELLNEVIDRDPVNRTITVQAGVTLRRLYEEVELMSLYFPPHPGDEGAFVGGAVATNAGGSRAVKYGTVRRFVLGLRIVLSDASVLDLGGKFIKSSCGYNLLDLMIGSEGTLGVITRITLGLLPAVGSVKTLVAPFSTIQEAIDTVPTVFAGGVVPCAVEFLEHSVVACAEKLLSKRWPAREGAASLLIILDGRNDEDVLAQAETVGEALEAAQALDVLLAEHKEKQAEILELRSMLYEALRPGTVELFDVCVPRSEIASHVAFLHRLQDEIGIPLPTYGHAADGNVHTHSLRMTLSEGILGREVPNWFEKHSMARDAIYADVVRRSGVISGEHGIGLSKRDFLSRNLSPTHIAVMRSIKMSLDPDLILNPGKILSPLDERPT